MDTANNKDFSAGLNLNTGDIVDCTVEQVMPYGAFVRISDNGRKGMIHISELSYSFVKDINELIKIQDKVKAKVIKIDERGRIDLSLKQLANPSETQSRMPQRRENFKPKFAKTSNYDANNANNNNKERFAASRPEESDTFEKKMASFLKTSEAKITDLNSRNSARSGRSTRRRNKI